ncbi:MAG: hypothetical protein ACREF3_04875 [Acetobacteraceae bacterium]
MNRAAVPLVMVLAASVLTGAAVLRGFEYDEAYSMFLTSGIARPAWPTTVFAAGSIRHDFIAGASPVGIARDLRTTDVHPPLYFWLLEAWRRVIGNGLVAARMLSVLCALGALLVVGAIARLSRVPPAPAMVLTLGCYAFTYTGVVARGFALAQLLSLSGVALCLMTVRKDRAPVAFGAGLLLGAASFANYLAAFVGAAALSWLGAVCPRRLWPAALTGFTVVIPADLWFFLAQRGSRQGQFPPFHLLAGLVRLGRCIGGATLGGLPLYVSPSSRSAATALLCGVLAGLAVLVAMQWRCIGRATTRWLLLGCAVAPAAGLIALGVVFDTTPIELRYLAFATPFAGVLLAGAIGSLPRPASLLAGTVVGGLQALALVGLLTRPETMQPARATAAAAAWVGGSAVVLLPQGNDGVGLVGPFLAEAPDRLRVRVVGRDESVAGIRADAAGFRRTVIVLSGVDADSRATVPLLRAAFTDPCWREAGVAFNVMAFDRICERSP